MMNTVQLSVRHHTYVGFTQHLQPLLCITCKVRGKAANYSCCLYHSFHRLHAALLKSKWVALNFYTSYIWTMEFHLCMRCTTLPAY